MKILMTGVLTAHANAYKRPPTHYHVQPHELIHDILVDLGHEIDWRPPIEIGQPIPAEYDLIWMYVFSPTLPSTTRFAMSYMWTMYQAEMQNVPIVWNITDWNYGQLDGAMSLIARSDDSKFQRKWSHGGYFYTEPMDLIMSHVDQIRSIGKEYVTPGSDASQRAVTLVLKFAHMGDIRVIRDTLRNRVLPLELDLTPFTIHLADHNNHVSWSDRKEAWLLPGLHVHEGWAKKQNPSWPVNYIGQRKLKVGRVTENEVSQMIAQHRGVLSPEYPHAGGGWWRMRFIYAAKNQAFIWGGLEDAKMFTPDEPVTLSEYESMTEVDQFAAASYQASLIDASLETNKQFTRDQIIEALNEAVRRSKC